MAPGGILEISNFLSWGGIAVNLLEYHSDKDVREGGKEAYGILLLVISSSRLGRTEEMRIFGEVIFKHLSEGGKDSGLLSKRSIMRERWVREGGRELTSYNGLVKEVSNWVRDGGIFFLIHGKESKTFTGGWEFDWFSIMQSSTSQCRKTGEEGRKEEVPRN